MIWPPALQQASRSATTAPLRRTLGKAVTSLQFALSLLLVAGAFLFCFQPLQIDELRLLGWIRQHLAMVDVDAREAGYSGAKLARLNGRILERAGGSKRRGIGQLLTEWSLYREELQQADGSRWFPGSGWSGTQCIL